jgi:hypothetical protein
MHAGLARGACLGARARLGAALRPALRPAAPAAPARAAAPRRALAAGPPRAAAPAASAAAAAASNPALAATTRVSDYATPPALLAEKRAALARAGPGGLPKALLYAAFAPFVWLSGAVANLGLISKVCGCVK